MAAACKPIIVCGPGSCGSSTVARWLHLNGVYMWKQERVPYGECNDFVCANIDRLKNGMDFGNWRRKILALKQQRQRLGRPWGFKDPRTADLIDDILPLFPEAVYVRVRRSRAAVVDSLCRRYGPPTYHRRGGMQEALDWACDLVDTREGNLDAYLEPAPVVKFDIDFETIRSGRLGDISQLPAAIAASMREVLICQP